MAEDGDRHVLSCGHAFHTGCIVEWFRRGGASTCPMCRDASDTSHMTRMDRIARSKLLQRRARRKDAPRELRTLKDRLQRARQAHKEAGRRRRELLDRHRETFREYKKAQSKEWSARRRIAEIECEFGIFAHPQYPVPLFVRKQGR